MVVDCGWDMVGFNTCKGGICGLFFCHFSPPDWAFLKKPIEPVEKPPKFIWNPQKSRWTSWFLHTFPACFNGTYPQHPPTYLGASASAPRLVPELLEELRGISSGSGVEFRLLLGVSLQERAQWGWDGLGLWRIFMDFPQWGYWLTMTKQ